MNITEIHRVLKRHAFDPFTVEMSDGSSYAIRHPDQVLLSARALYVGLLTDGRQQVAQDVAICDLLHITRLVPLRRRARKRRPRK